MLLVSIQWVFAAMWDVHGLDLEPCYPATRPQPCRLIQDARHQAALPRDDHQEPEEVFQL